MNINSWQDKNKRKDNRIVWKVYVHVPIIFIMFFFFLPIISYAQKSFESFAELSKYEIKYKTRVIKILYNQKTTTVINKKRNELSDISGIEGEIIRTIRTKISTNTEEYYIIDFDKGPSDDPRFIIYMEKDKKLQPIFSINGTSIVIPGNGAIYVSGHTNNMFDQRRKFKLEKDKFIEVPQPYYYVGLESKVKKRINIYSTPQQDEVVASLPEGAPVTVLLNKGEQYLLKTSFGLVGWVLIPGGSQETLIEGLYFAGD